MPMDKSQYAKNWPQQKKAALQRAHGFCEQCGVAHGSERVSKVNGKVSKVWLNAHHVDRDPWNTNARIRVLCPTCHRRREPFDKALVAGQVPLIPYDIKHTTYILQYRKCNKPLCTSCKEGQGHGPYWYGYYREGKRLRSRYIGKKLPIDNIP